MTRLVGVLDLYGEAIAADLAHEYPGVSIGDVFTGDLTPDELMNLIDLLPRTSRLSDAIHQDDELAELMEGTPVADSVPKFSEFTPEVEAVTDLAHRVTVLTDTVASALGGKSGLPPLRVPQGARERLAERRDDESYDDLLADVEKAHEQWRAENPKEG